MLISHLEVEEWFWEEVRTKPDIKQVVALSLKMDIKHTVFGIYFTLLYLLDSPDTGDWRSLSFC